MENVMEDCVASSCEQHVLSHCVLGAGWLFFFFIIISDGPVSVGMSLDIASIDTISEINMVL